MTIYTGFDRLHIPSPNKAELRAMIVNRVDRGVTPEEAVERIREVRHGPDDTDQ